MPVLAFLNLEHPLEYPLDFCRACSYNATHNTISNREETLASDAMLSAEGANLDWQVRVKLSGKKDPVTYISGKSPAGSTFSRDTDGAILPVWSVCPIDSQASPKENLSGL